MDKNHSLQSLLTNTATEEDIALLKRLLASGEISIGGNVNQSVIIIGSGNTVELPSEALDRLNARQMLGNLDRDLTGEEIASGLRRLGKLLQNRAPILMPEYKDHAERLRSTLKTEEKSLSKTARDERTESLAAMNRICLEAVDISFNSLCLDEEAPKYDARSPFRGLESFRPEDSEFFFGREALTEKLVAKIKVHSFLAVLGASGSGKSSLVMAGVIPALGLDYAIIRPGENPLEALESAKGKALLVVDQFEELFTLTKSEDKQIRADFISAVLDFARSGKVIITLRSDFLSEVGAYRSLSKEIQNHLETILPMDTDSLRRAMEGQARLTKLEFEADLSQQILEDVDGEPGAMPLLQHALWELWNRRHGRHLRASEYRAFGGVKQAITSTAEQVYGECSKVEQEQLREIFLRLTSLDKNDEGRDTRRRVSLIGLAFSKYNDESTNLLLDKLANARLIVKSVNGDKTEVEVVHEALIRHWERLRIWLNEDRDALRLRESVSESAKEWERSGRHESLLNSRWVKLDEALLLAQESRYQLTEIEQAYLKGCVGLRNREQRERERRLRYTVFVSIAAAMIFLALGSFGLVKSKEADSNARNAENSAATAQANASVAATAQIIAEERLSLALSNEIAAQSITQRENKFLVSLLLGVEAYKRNPSVQSKSVLIDNLLLHPQLITYLDNLSRSASEINYTPDGSILIVSGGFDRKIVLWDTKDFRILREPIDGENVAISPDGELFAFNDGENSINLWSLDKLQPLGNPLTGYEVGSNIIFSPDSRYIIFDSRERIVSWDIRNQIVRVSTFEDQPATIEKLFVSMDGNRIFSIDSDDSIREWDFESLRVLKQSFVGHSNVTATAISFDGKYLISGNSGSSSIVLWDLESFQKLAELDTRSSNDKFSSISTLIFSPDGKLFVSGRYDGQVIVWDTSSRQILFKGQHDVDITGLSFSPDGKFLTSASYDGVIKLAYIESDLPGFREFAIEKAGHPNDLVFMRYSPDGKYIMTGNWNGVVALLNPTLNNNSTTTIKKEIILTEHFDGLASQAYTTISKNGKIAASQGCCDKNLIYVWNTLTLDEIGTIKYQEGAEKEISPDGSLMALGGNDGLIYTVDMKDFLVDEEPLNGHNARVNSLTLSYNNKILASSSSDGTTILWDLVSKELKVKFDYSGIISFNSNNTLFSVDTVIEGARLVEIWDLEKMQKLYNLPYDDIAAVEFHPNGNILAIGKQNGDILIWDLLKREVMGYPLHGHVTSVTELEFSPNGKILASGSIGYDQYIKLWDFDFRTAIGQPITGHDISADLVYQIRFYPDGNTMLTSREPGIVYFWDINPESWLTKTCDRAGRNFTSEEWVEFFPNEEYRITCPQFPAEKQASP